MSLTEDLMMAALTASDERKEIAIRILRGEAGSGAGGGRREAEPFMTLKECAKRLGVSACSLWRWKVPGHELGGRRKVRMTEVEAYLQSEEFKVRAAKLRQQTSDYRPQTTDKKPVGRPRKFGDR